jgi:hypothetical protein
VPKLKKLHEDYKGKNFVIVAVHTKHSADKMPDFLQKQGIEYAVCVDENGNTAKKYKIEGYPTYVVLDKKGVVQSVGHVAPSHEDVDALLK